MTVQEDFKTIMQAISEQRMRMAIVKPKARKLLIWPSAEQQRWTPAKLQWFSRALGALFIGSSLAAAYAWVTWELMQMIFACTISLVSLRYLDRVAAHFAQDKALSDEAFFHAGRESGLIELESVAAGAHSRGSY